MLTFSKLRGSWQETRRTRMETLLRYKDILVKDKKGEPILALTRKAQVTAVAISVSHQNTDAFGLALITRDAIYPLTIRMMAHAITAIIPVGFLGFVIAAEAIAGRETNNNLLTVAAVCAAVLTLSEPLFDLRTKKQFIKYLKHAGPLILQTIERGGAKPVLNTPEAIAFVTKELGLPIE